MISRISRAGTCAARPALIVSSSAGWLFAIVYWPVSTSRRVRVSSAGRWLIPVIAKSSHARVKCWSSASRCSTRRSNVSGWSARPASNALGPYLKGRSDCMGSPLFECSWRRGERAGGRSFSPMIASSTNRPRRTFMAQSGRLADHVAIVTAGGQGIGEAICRTFAREGARVAVVDLNKADAERVAGEIGPQALAIEADVTKTPVVEAMVKSVLDKWGTIDILVNAAGG